MCSLEAFKIDLKGLKEDETVLEYILDDRFFGALDGSELERGALRASVSIRKATGFYELWFHAEGTVTVACDLCLDDLELPIKADSRLVVKMGPAYAEDDDLVTIDEDEGILDIAWFVYEFIALAIPIRHVHAPGKCNSAMMARLEEHAGATRSGESEQQVDPRWIELMKLKNKE